MTPISRTGPPQRLTAKAWASSCTPLTRAYSPQSTTRLADVERLRWFASDFVSAGIIDNELVISDLRMGQHPTYVFNHVVATASNPHWKPVTSRQLDVSFEARQLGGVWDTLWNGSATEASSQ